MKASYIITQNKFNAILNQETTEIKVSFKTGYYPFPSDLDLSNYYTKSETYSKVEVDDIISDIPVVDTSNLVPYTGATQDVNIASNYFKTSKGFDFTKDGTNFFSVSYSYYSDLKFISKDNSEENFGGIYVTANPEEGFIVGRFNSIGTPTNTFQINENETYSAKPFVSDVGFVKAGGTANQALTANGAVYDLTTKADLVGGKVPSSQLPSYVDDVLEFANLASFPATGESGKIYIAIDTNITYRWTGTGYVEISASLALGETSSTAYRGDRGKIAYDHSQITSGNPHGTTKTDIGLDNVDNTSDLDKPISTATQNALNGKQNVLTNPITGTGANGQVAFFNGTTTQIGDNGLFWDNTNKRLGVNGDFRAGNLIIRPSSNLSVIENAGTGNSILFIRSGGTNPLVLNDVGGGVIIGVSATPGARLDVRAQGALPTDIAFRVRNSTDTQNFLVVNGAGDVYNRGAHGVTSNTFFGENVGRSVTGIQNSAFGTGALRLNTTGDSNSAFGTGALTFNTTGGNNSAFGSAALYSNTTGNQNSAFGFNALAFNTTGLNNSAFGNNAGRNTNSGSNNEISNNSVFLGADTRPNASNETNQIVIGHSARGLGSNTVVLGNSSITRTALRGQTSINTDTIDASAQLQVDSTTRGFLPPRMTTTQRDAIVSPAAGLIVYDTTENKHYGYNGTTWNAFY